MTRVPKIAAVLLAIELLASAAVVGTTTQANAAAAPPSSVAVIDKNQFLNGTGKDETDFHLQIAGHFTAKPSSDKLPNRTGGGGAPLVGNGQANFSGGTVDKNTNLTVSFESDAANNTPMGFFTPDGSQANLIPSIAPNGIQVAFVPFNDDYLVTLGVTNADFSSLTGSLTAYTVTGLNRFNIDQFDTLNMAQSIFTLPNYSFGLGEGFNLNAEINIHQYILIDGTADTGDGSGPHPFALAFASVSVPEPGTLTLFGVGLLGLASLHRRRKVKA